MKFFVIGLGSIGKRHAKNLLDMGHIVWGYDKSLEVALQAKEQIPGLEIAADFFDCDACVICTPPDQHIAEIINAVEAGKHIFVEKPIGVPQDIEPLGKLLEEAKCKNLVVMVGNNLRFESSVREAKQRIKDVQQAVFTVRQLNTKYKEHVILNWGAHEIDEALYLLGPAKVESACGTEKDAQIFLRHESGCRSEIYLDYIADPEIRYGHIWRVGGGQFRYNKRVSDQDYMDEMREFEHQIYANQHNLRYESAGATGDDGLATLKIIADAMRMAEG